MEGFSPVVRCSWPSRDIGSLRFLLASSTVAPTVSPPAGQAVQHRSCSCSVPTSAPSGDYKRRNCTHNSKTIAPIDWNFFSRISIPEARSSSKMRLKQLLKDSYHCEIGYDMTKFAVLIPVWNETNSNTFVCFKRANSVFH